MGKISVLIVGGSLTYMIDFDELKEQVTNVIAYSQEYDPADLPHVGKLIDQWWINKSRFFSILGKKLIWEGPLVDIDYTDEVKTVMFDQFIQDSCNYLSDEECCSIEDIDRWESWLRSNVAGFFDNIVMHVSPDYDCDMKIGMKLVKSFKFFPFSTEAVRHIQDMASQIIQKNRITGQFCISIHPLDYLTISENNSNWRSCHALNGEYRSGNLSYMLDPSTIVCYIKSPNDVQLKNLPDGLLWNNKKWRVLFHVHPKNHIIYINRQYPFSCDTLINELLHMPPIWSKIFEGIKPRYYRNTGFRKVETKGGESYNLEQNYFILKNFVVDPMELCSGDKNSMQYNDFIFSPHYTPQYALGEKMYSYYGTKESVVRDFKVPIGVAIPCPCCGENIVSDSCCMICEDCQSNIMGFDDYD